MLFESSWHLSQWHLRLGVLAAASLAAASLAAASLAAAYDLSLRLHGSRRLPHQQQWRKPRRH